MHAQETFDILFDAASRLNLKPQRQSDYGLVSIEVCDLRHTLFFSTSPLNNELASYLASNKHASRLLFAEANLPNIPFLLPHSLNELHEFFHTHGKIIAKPTRGRQSQDVHLVSDIKNLDSLPFKNMIFEQYIRGTEIRVLILSDRVLAVHKRDFPGRINDPKSVRRIALEQADWDEQVLTLAKAAMQKVGLVFGAVDFIVADGRPYILEINTAPGLYFFKFPHSGPTIDIGRVYLETVAKFYDPDWKSPL